MTNQEQIEEALKWADSLNPTLMTEKRRAHVAVLATAYRTIREELEAVKKERDDWKCVADKESENSDLAIRAISILKDHAEKAEAQLASTESMAQKGWRERCEKAESSLATMTDERNEWEKRANEYSAELVALYRRLASEADCRLDHGGDLAGFSAYLHAKAYPPTPEAAPCCFTAGQGLDCLCAPQAVAEPKKCVCVGQDLSCDDCYPDNPPSPSVGEKPCDAAEHADPDHDHCDSIRPRRKP